MILNLLDAGYSVAEILVLQLKLLKIRVEVNEEVNS